MLGASINEPIVRPAMNSLIWVVFGSYPIIFPVSCDLAIAILSAIFPSAISFSTNHLGFGLPVIIEVRFVMAPANLKTVCTPPANTLR